MKRLFLFLFVATALASCSKLEVRIVKPNVEQQVHPMALATTQPRFSWQYESTANNIVQLSYRIIVASAKEKAQQGIGDLWDSQVVKSSQMLYVPHEGIALKSRDKAYWKVITESSNGKKKMTLAS